MAGGAGTPQGVAHARAVAGPLEVEILGAEALDARERQPVVGEHFPVWVAGAAVGRVQAAVVRRVERSEDLARPFRVRKRATFA
jgi:hypothetical protein